MTSTITEPDTIRDLDFEPGCQISQCGGIARWSLACVPCGCLTLLCDPCGQRHQREFERVQSGRKAGLEIEWWCYMCGACGYTRNPAAVYRLEPLR